MNKFYGFLVVLFSCLAMVTVTPVMASCIADGAVSNFDDCVGADKGAKDCLLAWSIDFDGNGAPPIDPKKGKKTTKVVCRDGDACDADGYANGVCTFALGVCANAGPDCAGAAILNINLKKPSTKEVTKKSAKAPEAYYNRRTVLAALGSVVGNSSEVCSADDLKVRVPLKSKRGVCASPAGQRCLNDQDCDNYCVLTYKNNKAVIKVIADDGGSNKDADALKLFCLPNSPGSVTGAEAFRVTDPADLVGGPLAMGRTGDWMIRNGNLRVVVRDSGRVSYWMVSNNTHNFQTNNG